MRKVILTSLTLLLLAAPVHAGQTTRKTQKVERTEKVVHVLKQILGKGFFFGPSPSNVKPDGCYVGGRWHQKSSCLMSPPCPKVCF